MPLVAVLPLLAFDGGGAAAADAAAAVVVAAWALDRFWEWLDDEPLGEWLEEPLEEPDVEPSAPRAWLAGCAGAPP